MEKQMVENSNSVEIAAIVAKLYSSAGIDDIDSSEYAKAELNKTISINANALGYAFDKRDDHIESMVNTFFTAVATLLSNAKSAEENKATAFVVQDAEGGFKFAVSVEYIANEATASDETKWSCTTIFSEEIFQDLERRKHVNKFFVDDKAFQDIFNTVSYDAGGFTFTIPSYITDICHIIVDSIKQMRQHTLLTIKMLEDFRLAIDELKAMGKDLIDQDRIHEAGIVTVFSRYMLGVHSLALEVEAYITSPDKVLPPDIDIVNFINSQIIKCSTTQKAYNLGITVDYEQILHSLEVLKGLIAAEQLDPMTLSDATVNLICVTLQADIQLIDDLFPESEFEDYVPEEEAKSEAVSDTQ